MIIRKYSGLLIFLLVLTSCVSTRNSTSDTEDSSNNSSSNNTDISETGISTSEEEPDPTLPEGIYRLLQLTLSPTQPLPMFRLTTRLKAIQMATLILSMPKLNPRMLI